MKRLFLSAVTALLTLHSFSQTKLQVVQDSVRVLNSELILRNNSRNVPGFLINKGNGVTEFKKALTKVNDSLYLVGNDTLKMNAGVGNLISGNGIAKSGDTLLFGGTLDRNTTINMNKKSILFNLTDGSAGFRNNDFRIVANRDTTTNANNLFIVHHQIGSTMLTSLGSGSVFAETHWDATDSFSTGYFPNYVSVHKQLASPLKMSNTTLVGFSSLYENYAGQKSGSFIHFSASPAYSNTGTIQTVTGLKIETLKGPSTVHAYAINTLGTEDSIVNAGPVRLKKYLNNAAADSILTTDSMGNVKLRAANTAGVNLTVQTLKDSSTLAWNVTKGVNAFIKLGGTGRAVAFSNPVAGQTYNLEILQDSIGSRTITTWPTGTVWASGVAPTLSTGANFLDLVTLYYNGTKYFGRYQLANRANTNVTILSYDAKAATGSTIHNLTGVPAGALLVLSTSYGAGARDATVTSSPSLIWTKRADSHSSGSGDAEIHTAVFAAGGSIDVTSDWGEYGQSSVCYTIVNQEASFGGASATAHHQGEPTPPSVNITTTRANSLLIINTSDWNAVEGTSRAYRNTPTETMYDYVHDGYTAYHYYKQATTVASYTVGLTAPAGQLSGTAVLEIRGN